MRPVSTESGYNREDLKEGVPLDAFEQVMTRKIRQQRYRRFALAILLVLLIPSVLIGCFLALNQFRIDMVMHGDSCITLEYGQKYTEPTIASILLCLESVFAVLGGMLLLKEALSMREIFGCVLMFAAIILTQIPQKTKEI